MKLIVLVALMLIFLIFSFQSNVHGETKSHTDKNGIVIIERSHSPPLSWIPLDAENVITWKEYEGEHPENYMFDAHTATQIGYGFVAESLPTVDCRYTFVKDSTNAKMYFNKDKSWVITENQTDALLHHEMGHIKIAEIYAQKLISEMKLLEDKIFLCSSNIPATKEIDVKKGSLLQVENVKKNIFSMWNFTDMHYDRETDHSSVKYQQDRWDKILDVMHDEHTLSLPDAMSMFPNPVQIYINNSKQDCGFLTFRDDCTFLNYNQLLFNVLVALIVAGLVAAYFYLKERGERKEIDSMITDTGKVVSKMGKVVKEIDDAKKKRREFAGRSFVTSFDFIETTLKDAEEAQTALYDKENSSDEKSNDVNKRFSLAGTHIRFMLGITADVLSEEIVSDVDYLCAILEKPVISGDPEYDSDQLITIESIIKDLSKGELKEDAKRFNKIKEENRKKQIEILKSFKKSAEKDEVENSKQSKKN